MQPHQIGLPFEGIRILDSTYIFALPYAAGIMADHGAEVVKIEGPAHIEGVRRGGQGGLYAEGDPGDDWWNRGGIYNLLNRSKDSLTLDMSNEKCRDIFRELVKISDVVFENFTPRVMRRWELDYPNLRKIRPDIIMVSNTGYGHGEGPYSTYPGVASAMEPTHGLSNLTGYIGGNPARAGISYVDFVACWTALFAVSAALRRRARTGKGQWIDVAMYQAGVMNISEYLLDYIANGNPGERIGNRHRFRAPQGVYPAQGEDRWIAISVGTDAEWQALCSLIGKPELAKEPRFASNAERMKTHDELDKIISEWTAGRDRYQLMEELQQVGIPAGPVVDALDMHVDPHYRDRGFLERVVYPQDRKMGSRTVIGRPWKLSKHDVKVRKPAPKMGEDNHKYLVGLLGMEPTELEELEKEGLISYAPVPDSYGTPVPDEELLKLKIVSRIDPEYQERLGIWE